FRARDPAALAAWYETHLGITPAPTDMDTPVWMQAAGPTVFSPFAQDTDYFAPNQAFMLNFRVDDLDAMLAELQAAGIAVSHEQEMEGVGRFARIHDPEGTPIELWQPPA
ncbi:MAG: VOC family protein, partial [Maritimibacter sp.]|nr:VOC family protein [Maritimibacter sp.]